MVFFFCSSLSSKFKEVIQHSFYMLFLWFLLVSCCLHLKFLYPCLKFISFYSIIVLTFTSIVIFHITYNHLLHISCFATETYVFSPSYTLFLLSPFPSWSSSWRVVSLHIIIWLCLQTQNCLYNLKLNQSVLSSHYCLSTCIVLSAAINWTPFQ